MISLEQKLNFYKYYRYLERGNEFMASLLYLGIKSPIFGVIGLIANVLKVGFKYTKINSDDIVQDWYCSNFSNKVNKFLEGHLAKYSIFKNKEDMVELFKVDNTYVICCEGSMWFETAENEKKILEKIFSTSNNLQLVSKDKTFDLVPIKWGRILPSERAESCFNRIKMFTEKSHSRSILLYGPPGTGKSSIALYIAHKFIKENGGTLLHLNLKDFEDFTPSDIKMFLEFIKADILIMDDIDRFNEVDSLLNILETNKNRNKIVLATANQILSKAARRPERFDEVFEINNLPEEILKTTFCELNKILSEEQRLNLLKWPIAYVSELDLRRRNITDFELQSEIEDLQERLDIGETVSPINDGARKRKKRRAMILDQVGYSVIPND